jgi:hypothetical protein
LTVGVVLIVLAGIALVVSVGARSGLDLYAVLVLGLILILGWLAITVARRSGRRSIRPNNCPECGGLASAAAPYCKHCGHRFTSREAKR